MEIRSKANVITIFLMYVVHFDGGSQVHLDSCGFHHYPCDSPSLLNYAVSISIRFGTKSRFQLRESTRNVEMWMMITKRWLSYSNIRDTACQIPVERSSEVSRNLGNASTLRCYVPRRVLGRKFQVSRSDLRTRIYIGGTRRFC